MLRKLAAILIVLIFFISQVGYYFLYSVKLYQVKQEVKREILASIPDKYFDVVCLEDNSSKIRWEEKGREFSLNGKMYDVARTKKMNGKTFYYCYNDSKEEKLISSFSKKLDGQNDPGSKHLTVKLQVGDWINTISRDGVKEDIPALSDEEFGDLTEDIRSLTMEVGTPPPDPGYIPANIFSAKAAGEHFPVCFTAVHLYEDLLSSSLPFFVAQDHTTCAAEGLHLSFYTDIKNVTGVNKVMPEPVFMAGHHISLLLNNYTYT